MSNVFDAASSLRASAQTGFNGLNAMHEPTASANFGYSGSKSKVSGDVDIGREILRDYIKATVRFEKLPRPAHRRRA